VHTSNTHTQHTKTSQKIKQILIFTTRTHTHVSSNTGSGVGNSALIRVMCVSEDGQWLASGDTHNRIHVFNLDTLKVFIPVNCS